jgi:electron transfer flavoprotein alpha subunit
MKIRVISDECTACGDCVEACPIAAVTVSDDVAVILENCNFCGLCVSACPTEAIEMTREEAVAGGEKDSCRGVWVFAEQRRGKLAGVAGELLGKGRELADQRGTELTAVLFGRDLGKMAAELVSLGADRVLAADHPNLELFHDDAFAGVLTSLVREHRPEIILCGATVQGRSFFPRVAARLGTGLTADCTELEIEEGTGNLLQTRPAYGGNIMATIACPNHRPQMSTVRPKVFKVPDPDPGRRGEIVIRSDWGEEAHSRTRVVELLEEVVQTVNIAEADVVVGGCRFRLDPLRPAGGADRQDGLPEGLRRLRHLRPGPASCGDAVVGHHHRHQPGPGGADLQGGDPRSRGRRHGDRPAPYEGAEGWCGRMRRRA